jgi:hypothetical protein
VEYRCFAPAKSPFDHMQQSPINQTTVQGYTTHCLHWFRQGEELMEENDCIALLLVQQ